MISFVCWKWRDARNGRLFSSSHVNVLAAMIGRNYRAPHRVICITDEPEGLDRGLVTPVAMPVTGFEHLINPSETTQRMRAAMPARRMGRRLIAGRPGRGPKPFPSCYRRLWVFSAAARELLGDRIFSLDIDVIVVGDLVPLVDRTASFVGWCDDRFGWRKIAGGAYLLKTGAHQEVWSEFDADRSPALAAAAGNGGSDQAWMSYKLYPPPQHWSSADGLLKLKWTPANADKPPDGARLVFTSGESPPWDAHVQRRYPWITSHWR